MPDPQTITGEKLSALTGLTDRRHRQLAKEGWFPDPKKGEYLLAPTIKGMFNYYRSLAENSAREEQVKLRNDLLRHSLQLKKRDVIPSQEIRRTFTRYVAEAKSKTWSAIKTASQEAGLNLGLNSDQMLLVEEKVSARVRGAFEALSRCEWAELECPHCHKEIKP